MSNRGTFTKPTVSRLRPDAATAIVEALNAGQPAAALALCASKLAGAPEDAALNGLAAIAAYRIGKPSDAEAYGRRCLMVRPDHLPVLLVLGRAIGDLGGDASPVFRRAVARAPDQAEPAFLLCGALLKTGNPDAQHLLADLVSRFPDESAGWADLGDVLLRLGQREAALVCLTRADKAHAGAALALRRGLILRDLGRTAEAAAAFQDATVLEPASARAWFLLGAAAQDAGEITTAAAAYRRALAVDPALAEAAVNLGTLLQEGGDLDGARAAYGAAIRIRSDTFGRVAQAMTNAPRGELWLDLAKLRDVLAG